MQLQEAKRSLWLCVCVLSEKCILKRSFSSPLHPNSEIILDKLISIQNPSAHSVTFAGKVAPIDLIAAHRSNLFW